ncbi:SRPBCC family protein [Kitasatospora atroaurantiaca]|uniref:SRPBCC family protein n=1 Tax=Kitasatospora atroaurantiaca TaxID=285545 RepID=UPI0011A7CAB2|nr:SRPBCC family protein [Kitasatospora atroaurantiaca]
MTTIRESIDVNVPVRSAYNQWTQFESFPQFMDGVKRVDQLGSALTHWVTRFAVLSREFDAEIVEQRPDECVVWRSLDGPRQAGTVTFRPLDVDRCWVALRVDFEPKGVAERAGDVLGVVRRRVQGDLERFKEFVEGRERETGAWRGTIHGGHVRPRAAQPRPRVPTWPCG